MYAKILKIGKTVSALVLTVAVLVSVLVFSGIPVDAWDGTRATAFASGSGTQTSPYVIRTESQLGYFVDQMNQGVTYEGLYVKLAANLNTSGNTWTYVATATFAGSFDGQGYTITTSSPVFGGIAATGSVVKLNVVASQLVGDAALSLSNNGTIRMCTARGDVPADGSGNSSVGLICADNYGTVQYCGAVGSAKADGDDCDAYAGMVGMNKGTVDSCFAAVTTSASASGKYNDPYTNPLGNGQWGSSQSITNSFYDKTLYTRTVDKGTGLTTEELKSQSFLDQISGNTVSGAQWVKGSDGYPTVAPACTSTVTVDGWDGIKTQRIPAGGRTVKLVRSGSGTIYYTTDGTDPKTSSTRKSSTASSVSLTVSNDTVISAVVYYNSLYSTPLRVQYVYMPGSGTAEDPYRIGSKTALDAVRLDPAAHYRMTANLTYSASDYVFGGAAPGGWTSIPSFTGVFDGAGYAIYNLEGKTGGLFDTNSGTVSSLRMVNHKLFKDGDTGPIANINSGLITKCYAKSAWTYTSLPSFRRPEFYAYSGGIAGRSSGVISYCSTEGIVPAVAVTREGEEYIGGIAGYAYNVTSCVSTAELVSVSRYETLNYIHAGGIIGHGNAYDCWADAEIYVDARINYDAYFGGISGHFANGHAYKCVADLMDVTQSTNAYIRLYRYHWASSGSGNYDVGSGYDPAVYPELDFETKWMFTDKGKYPRGVMDGSGHCYDMTGYSEPDCYNQAISVLKCSICGNTRQCIVYSQVHDTEVDAGFAATCTETGMTDGVHCVLCSKVLTPQEEIPALGHSFTNYVSNSDETCTADGTETAKCDRCDETDTRTDEGSAHHIFSNYLSNNDATCTADGTETSQCSRCDETDTRTDTGSKLPHSFTDYHSNGDATYLEDGTETAKCDSCDATDTRTEVGSRIKPIQIDIVTLPNKLSYKVKQTVDLTGLTFLATYADGSTQTFTAADATVEADLSTPGVQVAVITFLDQSAKFEIYVHQGGNILLDSTLYPKYTYYGKNKDITKTFTWPGAISLTVTFYPGTSVESNCDFIYLYDGAGNELGKYTGSQASGRTVTITGDTFKVRLTSDDSESSYGYSFSTIYANMGEMYHPAVVDEATVTCTQAGLSEGRHCEICGLVLVEQVQVSALGHSFTNYVSDGNATGLQDGTKTAKCDRCDATNTVTDVGSKLKPTAIEVEKAPTNRSYGLGDTVLLSHVSGLTLRATYSNGSQEILPATVVESVTGDTSVIGTRKATVTYMGCTAQYDIFVHNRVTSLIDATHYPQSAHLYANNSNETQTFTWPGAQKLIITFSTATEVEASYDKIFVYNGSGSLIAQYTGTQAAGVTLTIPGDTFKIKLTSDGSVQKYGYAFSAIVADGGMEHPEVIDPAVDATCTETGKSAGSHCSICGAILRSQITVGARGHNFVNYVSDGNATCTEDGTKTAKCSRCDETKTIADTGSALDHSFTNYVSDGNATCTEDGTKTAKCDRCDAIDIKDDPGSQTDHTFTNYVGNGDATYTEDGTETAKCDRCDATDTRTAAGSKLAPGSITITQLPDTLSYTVGQSINLTGLTFRADYPDGGTMTFTDENVDSVTADLSAPGRMNAVIRYMGCTATFEITVHNGGAVLLDASTYPESKHNYDSNTNEIKVFTWANAESLTLTFTNSTVMENKYDKLYLYDGQGNLIAEYTGVGAMGKTVTVPGDTVKIHLTSDNSVNNYGYAFSSIVANMAIEHPPVVDEGTATCTEGGLSDGSHCEICGMILEAQVETEALGHDMGDWVTTVEPTCTEAGSERRDCSRCDHFETNVIPENGHDYQEVVTAPTCMDQGYTTHTCACGDSYVDSWTDPVDHAFADGKCIYCGNPGGALTETVFWILEDRTTLRIYGSGAMPNYRSTPMTPWHNNSTSMDVFVRTLVIEPGVTSIGSYAFMGNFFESVTIADTVETVGAGAFNNSYVLQELHIPESVKSVGEYAFCGMFDLVSLTVPGTLENIGNNAFAGCESLSSLTIGSGIKTIPESCFGGNGRLTSVVIPDTVEVISSSAFSGCVNLSRITFAGGAPRFEGVSQFMNVIADVYYLSGLPGWTADVLQNYGGTLNWISADCAFFGKTHIGAEAVQENVTQATCGASGSYDAVVYCATCEAELSRQSVEIPANNHDHKAVVTAPTCTEQGYTTHTCACGDSYVDTYVTALGHDMGDWFTTEEPTCTEAGSERRDCSRCDHFETNVIPENGHDHRETVTAPTCTEQGYTTHTCACGDSYVDTYVTALGHAWSQWETVRDATCAADGEQIRRCSRAGCAKTETRVVPATENHIYDCQVMDEAYLLKPATCTEAAVYAKSCVCGKASTTETFLGGMAEHNRDEYHKCSVCGHIGGGLAADMVWELDAATGKLTIQGKDEMPAFSSNRAPWYTYRRTIKFAVVSEGITNISCSAFEDCVKLEQISIPESLTRIDHYAFRNCEKLTSIAIPASVTRIKADAFYNCERLTDVYISDLTAWLSLPISEENDWANPLYGVEKTNTRLYLNGTLLTKVFIPDGITEIPWYAFRGCSSITTVAFPKGVHKVGRFAFYGTSIKEVIIPDGIEEIEVFAFAGCKELERVIINTDAYIVGHRAFENCRKLRYVVLPGTMEQIEESAFENCTGLWHVLFNGTEEQWNAMEVELCNEPLLNATRHYNVADSVITESDYVDCLKMGLFECSVCHEVLKKTNPEGGHDLSDWEVSKAPTVTDEGMKTQYCKREGCTYKQYESIPKLTGTNGWLQSEGKWYYFVDGTMKTGWLKTGGYWYYLGSDGVMQTGKIQVGDKYYCLNQNGVMLTGWGKINGTWYYMDSAGVVQTGWQKIGNVWYYLGDDGAMRTGWQTIGSKKYYFAPGGAMASGITNIDGRNYCFASGGALQIGWVKAGESWYYTNSSGVIQTGWITVGSAKYYMNASGVMQTGLQTIGGKYYYFASGGAMQTGWQTVDGIRRYFGADGAAVTTWTQDDGKWYYLKDGIIQKGWLKDGNYWYFLDKTTGEMKTGWVKDGEYWYYMNKSGVMLTGTQVIDGKTYQFNSSGVWIG